MSPARSFPSNYWDKFIKRKVSSSSECPGGGTDSRKGWGTGEPVQGPEETERGLAFAVLQVLDKYGDIYGRERIAELLGMDLASLEISAQNGKRPEPDNSFLTW